MNVNTRDQHKHFKTDYRMWSIWS